MFSLRETYYLSFGGVNWDSFADALDAVKALAGTVAGP
jgi:hypothetical protein